MRFFQFFRKKEKSFDERLKILDEKSQKSLYAFKQVALDIEKGIENDEHIAESSKALKEYMKSVKENIDALYVMQKQQDIDKGKAAKPDENH
jgi:hypothetical protein